MKFDERLPDWTESFSHWGVACLFTKRWLQVFRLVHRSTAGRDPVMDEAAKLLKTEGIYEAVMHLTEKDPETARYLDRIIFDYMAEYGPPSGERGEFYRTLELADIMEAE